MSRRRRRRFQSQSRLSKLPSARTLFAQLCSAAQMCPQRRRPPPTTQPYGSRSPSRTARPMAPVLRLVLECGSIGAQAAGHSATPAHRQSGSVRQSEANNSQAIAVFLSPGRPICPLHVIALTTAYLLAQCRRAGVRKEPVGGVGRTHSNPLRRRIHSNQARAPYFLR